MLEITEATLCERCTVVTYTTLVSALTPTKSVIIHTTAIAETIILFFFQFEIVILFRTSTCHHDALIIQNSRG